MSLRAKSAAGARRRTRLTVAGLVAATTASLAVAVMTATPATAAPTLPAGFVLRDMQSGMRGPAAGDPGDLLTDFAFLPDESVITVGKFGKVAWAPQVGQPRQLAMLPTNATADLGLVGVAVAPDYATSRAIYTVRAISATGSGSSTFGIVRLSRWTVTVDGAGSPTGLANEQTVVQAPAFGNAHSMTGVVAAEDNTLWLSIGDLSDHRFVDQRAVACMDLNDYRCKLLHVRPDGSGVPTNPFYDAANPRAVRSLVYASGLRSPFRVTLEPGTGRPIVGDVGWNTTEEIDVIRPGNHYGWPCWEGNDRTPGYNDLPQCFGVATTAPIWSYPRSQGYSVTGGVVYTGTSYPEAYRGRYFFGDWGSSRIWSMAINGDQLSTPPETGGFGNDIGGPVAFARVPTGGDIVYADINTGLLRRIVYAPGNNPPTAAIKTTVDPATRTVTFDAGDSFDPNGDPLTYTWAFGDGATATGPRVSHTYAATPASFNVTLTATDPLNASGTAGTTVWPGNHSPVLTVQAPDPNRLFAAGELINASATATDQEDGGLTVTWTAQTVHCRDITNCHTHPGEQQTGPNFSLAFEGHAGDTHLEVSAVATDSRGARATQTFMVRPRQRRITVQSTADAAFTIGGEQTNSGLFTVGMTIPIIAPAAALDGLATFEQWSDGNRERVRELVLPNADQTLNVTYFTPIDRRYATDAATRTALGAPRAPEQGDLTLRWRDYQNGRSYWKPEWPGVRTLHGQVWTKYQSRGTHPGYGLPTTDQTTVGGGQAAHFQRGALNWQAGGVHFHPSAGVHTVEGAIYAAWKDLGAEQFVIGYPTTDETATPDGVGRYNHFLNGGSIYFSNATGAWEVHGTIRAKWASLGWERSFLGYPTSHEGRTADGVGRFNHFRAGPATWQVGSIYWTPNTAYEVHGLIRARWADLGFERSYLGYPISDEFAVTGGRRSNFQNGFITYDAATGQVTDRRY